MEIAQQRFEALRQAVRLNRSMVLSDGAFHYAVLIGGSAQVSPTSADICTPW
jgi:hypothetical protein